MSSEILSTHTPALFQQAVDRAVDLLRRGEVVALPTETVYGLAANAWDPDAVARIYAIKGRPAHNPVIVHIADAAQAAQCTPHWPLLATRLSAAFWPGPLTLVLPRSQRVPNIVTAGGPTVGLRWPQHPFMQAVIRACGFPLAAPSANPANALSPSSADHVARSLGDRLPLIIDGGDCNVGIESTVVDVTGSVPRILRPGILSSEAIAEAAGMEVARNPIHASCPAPLRSPGQLTRHYSPVAPLVIRRWTDDADLARQLADDRCTPAETWIVSHRQIPDSGRFPNVMLIPDDPEAYARALYGELHRCDQAGARQIVVEAVPDKPAWDGVADRLKRASQRENGIQPGEQR
jgi:L-threonylcarbamoyladenylate synthase